MATGFNDKLEQYQLFQTTPRYVQHKADEDQVAILVCQIKIWAAKSNNWFAIPDIGSCLTIRECQSIEISNSYRELVSKAVLHFPRGTVVNKSYRNSKSTVKVGADDQSSQDYSEEKIENATNMGELLTPESSTYKNDGNSVVSMAPTRANTGLIDVNSSKNDKTLLSPNDLTIGNRIEIRLGYAYSEEEYTKMTTGEGAENGLDLAFTGFITAISVDTPLEIECENMARVLALVSVPRDIDVKEAISIRDFFAKGGKYDFLKDTGLELSQTTLQSDIKIVGSYLSHNFTIADVLDEWQKKSGLVALMEDDNVSGVSKLRVGKVYYADKGGSALPNSNKDYITYANADTIPIIQCDWDVAEDKLTTMRVDKRYIAVEAQARKGNSFIKLTVRKNPETNEDSWAIEDDGNYDYGGQFLVNNEREPKQKKKSKTKDGTKSSSQSGKLKNKVDLSRYTIVPYFSTTKDISREDLIKEAQQYWATYSPNGISGSISIFGDIYVRPTDIVGLIDPRRPHKNGYYFVGSVNISFGVNGYRKELNFPYKIASFKKNVEII